MNIIKIILFLIQYLYRRYIKTSDIKETFSRYDGSFLYITTPCPSRFDSRDVRTGLILLNA